MDDPVYWQLLSREFAPRDLTPCGEVLGVPVATAVSGERYYLIVPPTPHGRPLLAGELIRLLDTGGALPYSDGLDRIIQDTIDALAYLRDHAPNFNQLRLDL